MLVHNYKYKHHIILCTLNVFFTIIRIMVCVQIAPLII